jgi:hypothetical protein
VLPLEPLLVAAATVLAGIALGAPMATVGLCFSVVISQSAYGSQRQATVRILALMVALPATVALSPISLGRHIPWNSAAVLGLVPMVAMMGMLLRALYTSLTRQEATAARETLLARTGSKLLNRTDAREVRLISREAAAALCAQLPGVGVLVLRRDDTEVVVEGTAGIPETARRAVLPADCLNGLDPAPASAPRSSPAAPSHSTGSSAAPPRACGGAGDAWPRSAATGAHRRGSAATSSPCWSPAWTPPPRPTTSPTGSAGACWTRSG